MSRLLRTALLLVAFLVAIPAFAAGSATPSSPTPGAQTSFARIAEDANGSPTALQLAIVTYAPRGGAQDFTVDLVSAIHVGDAAYYEGLNERFRAYDALLFEMVVSGDSGDTGAAGGGLGFITLMQNGLKDLLGLTFQLDEIDYDAANFVHADMSSAMLAESMEERGESLYVYFWRAFFASIDEYASDPWGVKDWRLIADVIATGQEDALKIALAHDLVSTSLDSDIFGGENGSAIIAARNEHAVSVLKEQIGAGNRRIGIFYGAAHMADFERRLVNDLSLEKTSVEWIDAWRFSSTPDL